MVISNLFLPFMVVFILLLGCDKSDKSDTLNSLRVYHEQSDSLLKIAQNFKTDKIDFCDDLNRDIYSYNVDSIFQGENKNQVELIVYLFLLRVLETHLEKGNQGYDLYIRSNDGNCGRIIKEFIKLNNISTNNIEFLNSTQVYYTALNRNVLLQNEEVKKRIDSISILMSR